MEKLQFIKRTLIKIMWIRKFTIINKVVFTVFLGVPLLSSCSIKPLTDIKPDSTSYPLDKVVEKNIKMLVVPGISTYSRTEISTKPGSPAYSSSSNSSHLFTYDYTKQEVGDSATHEIFIVPNQDLSASEEALFQQVPEKGKEICGDKYEILSSQYYFGTEATISMLGIQSPALEVIYRCPVYKETEVSKNEKNIRRISEDKFTNHIYFDTISKYFPIDKVSLDIAISKAIKVEKATIISRGKINEYNYIYASRSESFNEKNRLLDIVLIYRDQDQGSLLQFIYMPYQEYVHERGVMGTQKPSTIMGTAPSNRKHCYLRSVVFLSEIDNFVNLEVSDSVQ